MSVALLAPVGLFALTALALPVLIHLLRREEETRVEFAALRWLAERRHAARRWRIERPWLLLLRLLLLALLALLLARPVWRDAGHSASLWVVAAPGVSRAELLAAGAGTDVERRWLAPGFPSIDASPSAEPQATASLLRELDAGLPVGTGLRVLLPETLRGLDGELPSWRRQIDWQIVQGAMPDADTVPALPPLAIRYRTADQPARRYAEALARIWQGGEPDSQALDAPLPPQETLVIWLAAPTPTLLQWVEAGGRAIVSVGMTDEGDELWRDADGRLAARAVHPGNGRMIALRGDFVPADLPMLADDDFPARVRHALGLSPPPPSSAPAQVLSSAPAGPSLPADVGIAASSRPLDSWLIGLIALLFLAERLLASHRPDGVRP